MLIIYLLVALGTFLVICQPSRDSDTHEIILAAGFSFAWPLIAVVALGSYILLAFVLRNR